VSRLPNKRGLGVVQNFKLFFRFDHVATIPVTMIVEPDFTFQPMEEYDKELKYFAMNDVDKFLMYSSDSGSFSISSWDDKIPLKRKRDGAQYRYSVLPFFSFLRHTEKSISLSHSLRILEFFLFKELFRDCDRISERFMQECYRSRGDYDGSRQSCVDHVVTEKEIFLEIFFTKENLFEIVELCKNLKKPTIWNKKEFITTYDDYFNLLLDFYGENGSVCQYTNFDEIFLECFPDREVENLMALDMICGDAYVAEYPQGLDYKYYPFPRSAFDAGWWIWKQLGENLSKTFSKGRFSKEGDFYYDYK